MSTFARSTPNKLSRSEVGPGLGPGVGTALGLVEIVGAGDAEGGTETQPPIEFVSHPFAPTLVSST